MNALVVGYGSSLRTDDGVGQLVADHLLGLVPPEVLVLARHQLTPELAEDLANADTAVFVDADAGLPPGVVRTSPVEPAGEPASWSHHLTPASLLALAGRLYGRTPAAAVIGVGIASIEPGERPSAEVAEAVPRAAAAALRALEELGARPRGAPVSSS